MSCVWVNLTLYSHQRCSLWKCRGKCTYNSDRKFNSKYLLFLQKIVYLELKSWRTIFDFFCRSTYSISRELCHGSIKHFMRAKNTKDQNFHQNSTFFSNSPSIFFTFGITEVGGGATFGNMFHVNIRSIRIRQNSNCPTEISVRMQNVPNLLFDWNSALITYFLTSHNVTHGMVSYRMEEGRGFQFYECFTLVSQLIDLQKLERFQLPFWKKLFICLVGSLIVGHPVCRYEFMIYRGWAYYNEKVKFCHIYLNKFSN